MRKKIEKKWSVFHYFNNTEAAAALTVADVYLHNYCNETILFTISPHLAFHFSFLSKPPGLID